MKPNKIHAFLLCGALAFLTSCGGDDGGNGDLPSSPSSPTVTSLPFTDGKGVSNAYSAFAAAFFSDGVPPGYCALNCIRVVAVAQDQASATTAFNLRPEDAAPLLAQVDFSRSSIIIFDHVIVGPYFRLTIDAIEENSDTLRIRTTICSISNMAGLNRVGLRGFVVIPKRTKPAVFAPMDVTGLPPAINSANQVADPNVGACRS